MRCDRMSIDIVLQIGGGNIMKKTKRVAYVSTYTMGDDHGIKIYDVDMEKGRMSEKGEVVIRNSSYVTISHNGKYLYSIQVMELKGDIMHYIYKLTFPGTQRQYIKNAKWFLCCCFVFDSLNSSSWRHFQLGTWGL